MKSTKAAKIFWAIVGGIPLAIPVAMAIFGTILTILLLTHNFSSLPIFLASTLLIIPAVFYVFKIYNHAGPGGKFEKDLFNLIAILFVLGWIIFNSQFVAQSVFIDRDPGFYNVAGKWLASHDSSDVKVDMVFGNDENLTAQEGGMWLKAGQQPSTSSTHTIQPQGMHLFSAVLGVSGRIAGDPLMLRTGVIIGGLALLAFYGFARLIIRPRWAVLATVVLGFSMPMIYFSRDTYTEPLALLFAFGGLALLYSAVDRFPKINPFLLLTAGLSTGATALARPDGYFVVIACVIFFIVALLYKEKYKLFFAKSLAWYMAGASVSMTLGWLDMTKLTTAYYAGHGSEVRYQLILLGLVAVSGSIVYFFRKPLFKSLGKIKLLKKINYPLTVSAVLFSGFIILITRPFCLLAWLSQGLTLGS